MFLVSTVRSSRLSRNHLKSPSQSPRPSCNHQAHERHGRAQPLRFGPVPLCQDHPWFFEPARAVPVDAVQDDRPGPRRYTKPLQAAVSQTVAPEARCALQKRCAWGVCARVFLRRVGSVPCSSRIRRRQACSSRLDNVVSAPCPRPLRVDDTTAGPSTPCARSFETINITQRSAAKQFSFITLVSSSPTITR